MKGSLWCESVFATTALVAGISLMLGQGWAKKALYGIAGWLGPGRDAVAAMSVTMRIRGDPAATAGQTIAFLAAAAILTALAICLHWPLATSCYGSVQIRGAGGDKDRSADS